jgi:hypothetical protein
MLGVLEKLHYSSAFTTTVHQVSLQKSTRGFFKEFSERLANFPSYEIERIRRLERLPSSRLDTTHPPTVYRIDFLKTHISGEPKVVLDEDDFEKIRQELAAQYEDIQKRLVATYRAQLYG